MSNRPKRFHHDFETFSEADLPKVGSWNYSKHPSTDVLMLAYAFDGGPIKQWVPVEAEEMPAEVEDAMLDDRIRKFAWNSSFEWAVWKHCLGIETRWSAWRDPMVLAMSCSLPGSLDKAGPVIGLGPEYLKQGNGKALMRWFSMLRPATKTKPKRRLHWHEQPVKWEEYKEYNRYDVKAERKIYLQLSPYDMPDHEWELWALDREINTTGIPVNLNLVENVRAARDELISDMIEEMGEITGLDNPNSNQQLLAWLQDNGYHFTDLKKGHVSRAREKLEESGEGDGDLSRVLDLRSQVSRSSVKKFDALAAHTDPDDNRIRNCFQFAGAQRTWRWGGRVYQPQNLAKPAKGLDGIEFEDLGGGIKRVSGGTQIEMVRLIERLSAEAMKILFDRPIDVLSAGVRPVVQAPKGYVFIDLDWNAIENRVLGWLANDRKILRVFEKGLDPYIDFATYIYGVVYSVIEAEVRSGNKLRRTVAKPGVLGCGYMLGAGKQYENRQTGEMEATGLLGYAWNMGVKLTPEQSELSVRVWRETFKTAVQFWYDLERAARKCVESGKETSCGHVGFDRKGPFLRMILPSGRCLHYLRPRIEPWMMPWGDYKNSITYEGLNDRGQWERISTHPGKLTENADQAISRDILAEGLKAASREGIEVPMHVHDQIVALVPEKGAEDKLVVLRECMSEAPSWGKGLPLTAEGHLSKWFVKD